MKEAFDREMDSLLRRRARGTAEQRSWGGVWGEDAPASHLDADELSAFAEGALPAAARLAAASHLADCDRCRGVVVGLASVAAAGAEVEHRAVAATPSIEPERAPAWRAFIASLFTPRAMRFAVPVLALSLVGVVSYVALRSDRGAAVQMARDGGRRPGTQSEQPNASASSNTTGANDNPAGLTDANTNTASAATTATTAPPPAPRGGHGGTVEHPVVVDGTDSAVEGAQPAPPPPAATPAEGPAEMSKAAPKPVMIEEGEAARADSNKERSENRDKPARAPEPMDEIASGDISAQQRNSRARVNEVQMPDGGAARNQQRRGTDNNTQSGVGSGSGTGSAPAESPSGRAGSRSEPARRARAVRESEQKADEDDVVRVGETRSAAGHRFRREGNAWVDVNYKPSMRSTGVRRGTESYRALVADVPEVGRVAEAISGAVIVVVGGRAYHIR